MSIPGSALAVTGAEAGALAVLQYQQARAFRSIAGLTAQVTPEEEHEDELAITEHPVEFGAYISDHAYKRPARLIVRCGWSNSPSPANTGLISVPANIIGALGATAAAFSPSSGYVQQVYQQLLVIQAGRQPFQVWTGKRAYRNMLFERISLRTDVKTENALMVVAYCKEVILVSTSTVRVVPAANQRLPETSTAVQNQGQQALQPGTGFNYDFYGQQTGTPAPAIQ